MTLKLSEQVCRTLPKDTSQLTPVLPVKIDTNVCTAQPTNFLLVETLWNCVLFLQFSSTPLSGF